MKRLLLLCGALALMGCVQHPPPHENLPVYPWTDDQTALRELALRARAVKTVSAAALLTLRRPDGQSVRLDGAVAISLVDKSVRLRAWKLSQAVFDLTLTPAGLWIETPKDTQRHQQIAPASLSASKFARALSIFGGEVFQGPEIQVIDHGGPCFSVRKPLENGQQMTAEIDRATLTVRQYQLADSAGVIHLRLTLRDYHLFNGIPWPTHLTARSDDGTIDVELRDVELNGQLPPGAFIPPRGAEQAS
jgi:outer membrane lipoprotein-sorting protein